MSNGLNLLIGLKSIVPIYWIKSWPTRKSFPPVKAGDFSLCLTAFLVDKFISQGKLPHLLFYGPPGTGKTSTAKALAHNIFGNKNGSLFSWPLNLCLVGKSYHSSMVLELNASDERGIDVVRDQIKTFAATRTFSKSTGNDLKLVILDEADAMTSAAQNALRRVMEKYVRNVRFIIICNYVGQIIPPLQSRCTRFRFAPLPFASLQERMDFVIQQEGISVSSDAKKALIRIANGDMRRVLNVLQATAAAFHPKQIDEDAIYAVTAAPHPTDMQRILDWLTNDLYDISQSFNCNNSASCYI